MADANGFKVRFYNRSESDYPKDSDTEVIVSFGDDNSSNSGVEEACEAIDEDLKDYSPKYSDDGDDNLCHVHEKSTKIEECTFNYIPSKSIETVQTPQVSKPILSKDSTKRMRNLTNSSVENNNCAEKLTKSSMIMDVDTNVDNKNVSSSASADSEQSIVVSVRNVFVGRYRFFCLSFFVGVFFALPVNHFHLGFLCGFLIGIYIALFLFFCVCVSDPISSMNTTLNKKLCDEVIVQSKKDDEFKRVYKGWMNILNEHYSPRSFHVNTIQTVLVRLDGTLLRISKPERSLLKHTFHSDPTLTEPEPRMISQNIYDLTNATVKLRPRRLAKRRWFSRKYPICIRLPPSSRERSQSNRNTPERQRNFLSKSNTTLSSVNPFHNSISMDTVHEPLQNSETENKSKSSSSYEELAREANCAFYDTMSSCSDEDDADSMMSRSVSDYNVAGLGQKPRRPSIIFKSKSSRTIYLFARSAREKERWFHRLRKACSKCVLENFMDDSSINHFVKAHSKTDSLERRRFMSLPSFDSTNDASTDYLHYLLDNIQFSKHLEDILPGSTMSLSNIQSTGGIVSMDLGRNKWKQSTTSSSNSVFIVVVNLLASRIFYDFCRDEYWCKAVQKKIQTKLATIHLPYFIETLELSNFEIGIAIPKIVDVYPAVVDDWGVWIDFEIKYNGLIKLMIETKVNLMKLKEQNDGKLTGTPVRQSAIQRSTLSRYSDEELPESPETSPDEEFGCKTRFEDNLTSRKKTGKKLLTLVDKITQSKYFKEASELKPIRKVMEEISSTRLILNVEITALEGTMTINLPPPPSDRLWYGFRKPPKMSVKAVPQVGDRSVAVGALSDWIESKICLLLEKNLVCPNLDDVVIPVLSGNTLLTGPINL